VLVSTVCWAIAIFFIVNLPWCFAPLIACAARNMDGPHDKPTEIARMKIAGRGPRRTVFADSERRQDSGIFQPTPRPGAPLTKWRPLPRRPERRLGLVEAIGHPAARAVRRRAIQRHSFVAKGQFTTGNLAKLGVPR
jgi:hypothetical protein